MGILDDAIREHLDLKRLHGAEDDEVKRLEDEAFGPPARPGEPDFPESQEHPQVEGEAPTGEAPAAGAPAAGEEATALLERDPSEAPPTDDPSGSAPVEIEAPPPAPEPPSEEHAARPPAPDPEATEPEGEGAFFDQELQQDLNIDDLGPADEAPAAPAASEPVSEEMPAEPVSDEMPAEPVSDEMPVEPASEEMEAEPVSDEHPVEPVSDEHSVAGLETVEHPMDELLADDADAPAPQAPATGEEALVEEGEEAAGGEDDEDVLEETPEFLRDQPEDDELWFEQGEPKDFDF
jgi:hypothetical protein